MSTEQDQNTFSKWRWAFWAVPFVVTVGLFVGTLKLDARRELR